MINTPQEDIKLPKDIKNALNDAKNKITLANAELARLNSLRLAEEITIVEKNKQKVYLESQLKELKEEVSISTKELKTVTQNVINGKKELDTIKANKSKIEGVLAGREDVCIERENYIKNKEETLANSESNIIARESDVVSSEEDLSKRKRALEDVLKII